MPVEQAVQVLPGGERREQARIFRAALGVELGPALEAPALAREHVDEVELDRRPGGDVGERVRRADLAEADAVVVDHRHGALRRQIRRAVGIHGGDEAQGVVAHQRLHGGGQDRHGGSLRRPAARAKENGGRVGS